MSDKQTEFFGSEARSIVVLPRWWRFKNQPVMAPLIYLVVIAVAEYLTASVDLRLGLPLHVLVLMALVVHGGVTTDESERALMWGLTLAPLIRIVSLSLPVGRFPTMYWYAIISVPLFAATIVAARSLGYTSRDLGLTLRLRNLPLMVLLVPLGLMLGVVEHAILAPDPLSENFMLSEIWLPAIVLTVSTGLEEELIFRGLLQRAALRLLGSWGLVYVSALFAILHIGYFSPVDLIFVFAVGLSFAYIARRAGSIVGVTLAHSSINISLFLIAPFLSTLQLAQP